MADHSEAPSSDHGRSSDPNRDDERGQGTARAPQEELRLALVLNGGVSLAVWMGGVVTEIDRLTRGAGPYAAVLDLLRAQARVDVVTGTSAGGINGAALVLAQANRAADLSVLRDVWAEQGRMESLLRPPFKGSPPSLLKGDEFFLPALERAFQRIAEPWDPYGPDERPVDLTITTTLLRGARTVTVDSLGQRIPQTTHEGRFRFLRGAPTSPGRDDLDPDLLKLTIRRLALAARCTASFPVAFEPSYVPVRRDGPEVDTRTHDDRPDMSRHASWLEDGPGEVAVDRSRYAVDGGLLVNTPTRAALAAIDAMPAGLGVRRVMLLVHPHAATVGPDDAADRPDAPPSLSTSTTALLAAMGSQGSRSFVEDVEAHNRAATSARGGRQSVVRDLAAGDATGVRAPDPVAALYDLATAVHAHYRSQRLRREAMRVADTWPAVNDWPWERVRTEAVRAQERTRDLPYVPDTWVWPGPGRDARAVSELGPDGGWGWGLATVASLTDAALDIMRLLVGLVRAPAATEVAAIRTELHEVRADLRSLREDLDAAWYRDPAERGPDDTYWTGLIEAYRDAMGPMSELGERTRLVALRVAGLVARGAALIDVVEEAGASQRERQLLDGWARLLTGRRVLGEPDDPAQRTLSRLVALDVVTTVLADSPSPQGGPIDLVQVSLQTPNPFARYSLTPDDKVGGYSLGRFSGFLKRSWRINDWAWGRIDGATMLLRTALSPERLRRVARIEGRMGQDRATAHVLATRVVDDLVSSLLPGVAALPALLEEARGRAVDELSTVYLEGASLPRSLPELAALVAWVSHVDTVLAELPVLAEAIRVDEADGAYRGSRGRVLLQTQQRLIDEVSAVDEHTPPHERLAIGLRALAAFDRAGIGREPLAEEGGSDQMVRTAATAAGVGVTLLDAPTSGLGAMRPVTRVLRGAALLPYWSVVGLTRGGPIARFVALMALAAGGVAVALSLLAGAPGWVTALGAGVLLTAFGYGALRTGSLLHGVVLLSPIVPLTVVAANSAARDGSGRTTFAAVCLVVLGLIVLGSLPNPVRTPFAVAVDTAARVGRRLHVPERLLRRAGFVATVWLGGATAAAAAVGLVLRYGHLTVDAYAAADRWLRDRPGPALALGVLVAGAVAALVGAALARRGGSSFRRWQAEGDADLVWRETRATHPVAATAGWSVVYGVAYVLVTAVVAFTADGRRASWWSPLLLTTAAIALLLLVVVPAAAPRRARRAVERSIIATAVPPSVYAPPWKRTDRADADLLRLLVTRDERYRWLVTPDDELLVLTARGSRVRDLRLARARADAAGRPVAPVGRAARRRAPTAAPAPVRLPTQATSGARGPVPTGAGVTDGAASAAVTVDLRGRRDTLDLTGSSERGHASPASSGRG